jgi:DNA adenine methylase
MKEKRIKPPFGYFGSKHRLALKLCENLPPHNCWIEAFSGSAAMTLVKEPAPIEIINDIDQEIFNVFLQLRDNYDELIELIEFTPYASDELKNARIQNNSDSDLERARKFIVQAMMAVNGTFGKERGGFSVSHSYSRRNLEARVSRWVNLPSRLEAVVKRLQKVRIENKDALELLENYSNRPATLIYLDPPYFAQRSQSYNIDAMDENFHERLISWALDAKCMVFISGYESELYNSSFSEKRGWSKTSFPANTKGVNGDVQSRTEIVWMNYWFSEAVNNPNKDFEISEIDKKRGKLNPD